MNDLFRNNNFFGGDASPLAIHPDVFFIHRVESECEHCPQKNNMNSWRQKEDIEFRVTCDKESAIVNFDMEKMQEVGWMENVLVQLQLKSKGKLRTTSVEDIKRSNRIVDITLADEVCLSLTRGSTNSKLFCEVRIFV